MTAEPVKFLLVDDTPENIVALEALLRREGLQLLPASSGAEALELLLVHEVALAIVDVQMPEMNGFELAELMRGMERTKHVPIIFLTAGTRDPVRVFKGYEAGAVDFLFKPIEPHVLKSKTDVFFQLHRQKAELTENLRMNEMFVGILGHDLRNPLGSIVTGARLLEKQLTDESQHRTLRRMVSSAARMNDMIEQLMDLTRVRLADGFGFIQAGRPLDVGDLVVRAVDELRGTAPDREIVLKGTREGLIEGDGTRLLQVFSNLVSNALRHGTEGTPVQVTVDASDQEIVVVVQNQGLIPADLLPRIFDPFRGARTAHGSQGLGLGLFISQQIVRAHGGTIAADSKEGGDTTTFTVRLPRTPSVARPVAPSRSKRLLIVDDDDAVRESLVEVFEDAGYEVATAANGKEALDILSRASWPPDVVILDLVMPIMDGAQLYKVMGSDPRFVAIPVVVSTATPAQAPPGAIVVSKPVKLDVLLDTVARLSGPNRRPEGAPSL